MVKSKYLEKVVAIIMVAMLCLTAVPHVIMAAGPAYALNGTIGSLNTITNENVPWNDQTSGTIKIELKDDGSDSEFSAYKLLDITKSGDNRLQVSIPDHAQSFWKKYLNKEQNVTIGMIKEKLNSGEFTTDAEKSNSIVTAFLKGGFTPPDIPTTATVDGNRATLATTFGFYMIQQTKAPAGGYIASAPVLACLPMQKDGSWKSSYTVRPKDDRITINKQVRVQGETDYKKETIAEIGDILEYKIVADLAKYGSDITRGEITYTLVDELPKAIEYNGDAVVEFHKKGEPSDTYVSVTGYETVDYDSVNKKLSVILGTHYATDFANYDEVKITYKAKFNQSDNIVIEGKGNSNTAKLSYTSAVGQTPSIITSTAKAYTLELDITKVEKGNTSNHLKGATFQVYKTQPDANNGVNAIEFIELPGTGTAKEYRVATEADTNKVTDIVVSDTGEMKLYGLNDQYYHFKETVAPVGYNIPDTLFSFEVKPEDFENETNRGDYNTAGTELDFNKNRQSALIENDSGINLPVTGGMGTILFTAIGLLLMAGAAYFLFAKKKESR